MESFIQVTISGFTLGAMYSISVIGLALLWGALRMLNMAQGALLAVGGYASFAAVTLLGLPWYFGLPASMAVGLFSGIVFYYLIVRWMFQTKNFEVNIIIATVGLAIVIENVLIRIFGAYPKKQPFFLDGGIRIHGILLPNNTLLILGISVAMMLILTWLLTSTRAGRTIRATAQNPEAARLVGIRIKRVYAHVLIIAGIVAAVSGVLLTSLAPVSPQVGHDPMLKAFIICVIAGLGNIPGAIYSAFLFGFLESALQYTVSSRYAFPIMLAAVIAVLVWRPYGVFGTPKVVKR